MSHINNLRNIDRHKTWQLREKEFAKQWYLKALKETKNQLENIWNINDFIKDIEETIVEGEKDGV